MGVDNFYILPPESGPHCLALWVGPYGKATAQINKQKINEEIEDWRKLLKSLTKFQNAAEITSVLLISHLKFERD